MIPVEKIVVALDTKDVNKVEKVFQELAGQRVWLKVGMENFYSMGAYAIKEGNKMGFRIFLDLKLHDIPNTVAGAMASLCQYPIDMINVHAAGGSAMMRAAVDVVKSYEKRPLIVAVTQLTSTSQLQMNDEQNIQGDLLESVVHYAKLAKESGCDGVVCSPHEVQAIKLICGTKFITVTPGIRPLGTDFNDQSRITTPMDAFRTGTDFMVIGRPITDHTSPKLALANILKGS